MVGHGIVQRSGDDVCEGSDAEGYIGLDGWNDVAVLVAHLWDGEPAMHLVERLGFEDGIVDDVVIEGDLEAILCGFLPFLLGPAVVLGVVIVGAGLRALV